MSAKLSIYDPMGELLLPDRHPTLLYSPNNLDVARDNSWDGVVRLQIKSKHALLRLISESGLIGRLSKGFRRKILPVIFVSV